MTQVADPCYTEGLFVDATTRQPGIGNLRAVPWTYPGTIQTKTGLKRDPATGYPYTDPVEGTIVSQVGGAGRSYDTTNPGEYLSGGGVSMLAGGVPNVQVSITNTGQRAMRVKRFATWKGWLQVGTLLTTAGENIRIMGLTLNDALDATPADPSLAIDYAWGGSSHLTSHYDAGGFGGYVGMGQPWYWEEWWNGGAPALAPGHTWNTKMSIGYSSHAYVNSAYDRAVLVQYRFGLMGVPVGPAS